MNDDVRIDDPLAVIEEEVRALARGLGAASPDDVASLLVDRILLRLGGAHIYVPKRRARERQRVLEAIRSRFNGSNLFELAREFGLTPRHVRRLLASQP